MFTFRANLVPSSPFLRVFFAPLSASGEGEGEVSRLHAFMGVSRPLLVRPVKTPPYPPLPQGGKRHGAEGSESGSPRDLSPRDIKGRSPLAGKPGDLATGAIILRRFHIGPVAHASRLALVVLWCQSVTSCCAKSPARKALVFPLRHRRLRGR